MTTRLRAGLFVAMIAIIAYGTAPNFLVPEVTSSPTAAWMNVTDAAAAVPNVLYGANSAAVSTRAAPVNTAAANMVTNFTVIENARAPAAIDQAATDAHCSDNVLGAANDFKKQYDAVNHGKMVSLNSTIGTARAAPATNDFKTTTALATIDAKKNPTIGARAAPAIQTVATGRTNFSSSNSATTADG